MPLIISSYDHKMRIPPNFKGLTGKNWFEQEFKAGELVEVPEKIADYYTKNWSKKYRYPNAEEKSLYTPEEIIKGKEVIPEVFNPVKFIGDNYDNIEEAVKGITDRKQLFAICEILKFSTGFKKQPNDRLMDRIINDISAKKAHEKKLVENKNEGLGIIE